jgi:hypothetical protein
MRRSPLLIFVALVQSVIAVFWLVVVAYIWSLMGNTAQFGKDAATVLAGLKAGLVPCGTFALLNIVAALGMWRLRGWARWVGAFGSGVPAIMLLSDLPTWLSHPDWEDIAVTALLVLWTVFVVLPPAGRAFRNQRHHAPKLEVQEN